MPTLATTRYIEVGTYIGQFFIPGTGSLPNDSRVVCIVARGDRLLLIRNNQLKRSFVFSESLSFTSVPPYIANLDWPADGSQSSPVRLFTNDGLLVTANKWQFIETIGGFTQVQILDNAFDPLASYFLDYQSTSSEVKDTIPDITIQQVSATAQVRQILAVGSVQDQQDFVEYQDFFGDFEVDAPLADTGNANLTGGFTAVNATGATGTGTVAVSSSAAYSHLYNRVYRLEVTAAAGVTPTRTATLAWSSTPVSYGNGALPPVPLNPAAPAPQILLDETNILSLSDQLLELGVVLDFAFGASNYVVGDVFYLQAEGPGLVELDPLLLNTNQFNDISAVAPTLQPGSTGSLGVSSLENDYALTDHNLSVRLLCIAAAGATPTRTATFVWAGYGTTNISGSFAIAEASPPSLIQPLGASGISVTLAFGASNFIVGDRFDFLVKAPRVFYRGKESIRNITLTIGSVAYPAANQAVVSGGFLSDTPEGRFGSWTSSSIVANGRFEITDGLRFYVRNTYVASTVDPVPGGARVAAGDAFELQARFLSTLNFSLQSQSTEVFENPSAISTDISGSITGIVGAKYITLAHLPTSIAYLRTMVGMTPIAYVQVAGTPFLRITEPGFSSSTGDLQALYQWQGAEPIPGQYYFLSAFYLRPDELYERPFLFLSQSDSRAFLAPSTTRNDLYIGTEIAWDYNVPGVMIIQVKDSDDDGTFSKSDFRRAINAYRQDRRSTDLIVLNFFQALPDQLQVVDVCNDPFELHESLTFVGAPIGTPIGSELETGSLIFLSRKTLAVYGQSPAHGSRILHGSTRATRDITLEDGTATSVTLDGSFIALALAALNSSFTDPKTTVLLKNITSFSTMQTYGDQQNRQLGANNIIFFKDLGNGVFSINEDITTDPFSPDTLNLNQMVQKQFVTRYVRRQLNQAIISLVFPSAQSGIATIQSILAESLNTLETNSLIGNYQDDQGNDRDFNTTLDTFVTRDQSDPTLFHIGYNYFLAATAKRILGLYTVNLAGGFPR